MASPCVAVAAPVVDTNNKNMTGQAKSRRIGQCHSQENAFIRTRTSMPPQSGANDQRREPMNLEAKCPFHHAGSGRSNRDWWPEQLQLDLLAQHSSKSNP